MTLFLDLTTPADGLEPYQPILDGLAAPAARRLSLPIPDLTVASGELIDTALSAIDAEAADGGISYVHCWGGIGRTGTIIGCWLARSIGGEAALTELARLRDGSDDAHRRSPETAAQRDAVRTYRPGRP